MVLKDGELQQLPGLCTQVMSFSDRKEHEDNCPFAPQMCPNSEQCGSIRKRDVDRHISECVRTPCQHKKSGDYILITHFKCANSDFCRHQRRYITFGLETIISRIIGCELEKHISFKFKGGMVLCCFTYAVPCIFAPFLKFVYGSFSSLKSMIEAVLPIFHIFVEISTY